MRLVDWLTIAGLVIGPISAVLITLLLSGFAGFESDKKTYFVACFFRE